MKKNFLTSRFSRSRLLTTSLLKASARYGLKGQLPAVQELVKTMAEMKGGLMKLGQVLSISDDLLLPPEISQLFSSLQNEATPMSSTDLQQVLDLSYPQGYEQVFCSFQPSPIAQASIGQVHRAQLKTGERVVVKIQYPEIEKAVAGDMKSLDLIDELLSKVWGAKPNIKTTLEEIKESLIRECDYTSEANHLSYARQVFLQEFPQLRIPRVYDEFSTKQTLVLEEMIGQPFSWTLKASQKQKDQWGQLLYDLHQFSFSKARFVHTDPQPANYLFNDNEIILLDFGSCRSFELEFVRRYTKILEALEQDDFDTYAREVRYFGFFTEQDSRDLINSHYHLIRKLYAPYSQEGIFPLQENNPFDVMRPFLKQIDLKGRSGPVKEFFLLDRAHYGLYTKLRKWKARINWVDSRQKYRRYINSDNHSLKS